MQTRSKHGYNNNTSNNIYNNKNNGGTMIRYLINLYMLTCTVVITSWFITSVAYATHGEEHGPGWHSSNCDSQPWQEDQAEICNMMGLEMLIMEYRNWKVWEFDDSYIIQQDNTEVIQWDCVIDDNTSIENLFFCEVVMTYSYDQ